MSERSEREDRPGERLAAEGVRIIGPEEAQAALDAGQAGGRRAEDELRFGDVPPVPVGPRPPHRFPLPDSVDPAEAVPRPPVVQPPVADTVVGAARARVSPAETLDDRPGAEAVASGDRVGEGETTAAADEPPMASTGMPVPPAPPAVLPEGIPGGGPAASDAAHPTVVVVADSAIPSDPAVGRTGGAEGEAATEPPPPAPAPAEGTAGPTSFGGAGPPALPADLTDGPAPGVGTSVDAAGSPVGDRDRPRPPSVDPDSAGHPLSSPGVTGTDVGHEATSSTSRDEADPAPAGPPGVPVMDPSTTYRGPWSERPASFRPGPPPPPLPVWNDDGGSFAAARPATTLPPASMPLDEGITVTGGFGTELPHWTDPPTGEVPRIRPGTPGEGSDDLAAWEALGSGSTRWRDDTTGWGELGEMDDLADDEAPVGALDNSRTEHSDLYSFDEDFERLEEERSGSHPAVVDEDLDDFDDFDNFDDREPETIVVGAAGATAVGAVAAGSRRRTRAVGGGSGGVDRPTGAGGGGNDLGLRVAVGLGLVVALLICLVIGPVALMLLSTVVVLAAAVEVFDMLRHSGFRPATLLGLVATVGIMFAAYWRGPGALPLIVGVVFVVSMLWYLLGVDDARPLANVAVTLTAFVWVGALGSYAALLLRSPHGRGLFVGAVLPAVAADIVAYFTGRRLGERLLAPSISPAKTLEGVIGGGIAAVVVGLVVGHSVTPWGGLAHGLLLGLVVAVLAPVGDLFESMIKRDLNVKDSGSVLPGHGGFLDRFDSVLLVLPAAYYLAALFNVAR